MVYNIIIPRYRYNMLYYISYTVYIPIRDRGRRRIYFVPEGIRPAAYTRCYIALQFRVYIRSPAVPINVVKLGNNFLRYRRRYGTVATSCALYCTYAPVKYIRHNIIIILYITSEYYCFRAVE